MMSQVEKFKHAPKFEGRAYGDRVLVKDPDHQTTTASGLIFVGGDRLDVVESTVISIGPLVKDKSLCVGDRVVHTRVTGVKYQPPLDSMLPPGHYRFVKSEELFAVLSKDAVFEGGKGFYDDKGEHVTSRS